MFFNIFGVPDHNVLERCIKRCKYGQNSPVEAWRQNLQSPEQDDRFFFIAGYISGGAPYGITWEEMAERIDDETTL